MTKAAHKKKTWVRYIPFFILVFFFVLAFGYQGNLDARATVGEEAPDFQLPLLDGETIRLSDFKGHPVVINFWTTWCTECRTEMPALESVYRRYEGDVVVLGVNMRESKRIAASFVDEYDVHYPIVLDQEKRVARSYRVTGVPETWIVSPGGIAVERFVGPVTAEQLEQVLTTFVSRAI